MEHGAFALEVRVHGRTVREYQSNNEIWIEGRKGTDFTLRILNRTAGRVLAVVTVDGLSVMNGEEASYDSGGYVLAPFGHIDIPGWRLDNDKVASFRFHKSGKSYASQKGTPRNIGVIGCGFFTEKQPQFTISYHEDTCKSPPAGVRTRSFAPSRLDFFSQTSGPQPCSDDGQWESSNCNAQGGMEVNCSVQPESHQVMNVSQAAPSLGTEFGAEMAHRVMTTTFQKAHDKPDTEMAIRYGDRGELEQRGIDLHERPVVAHRPSAFPKEETGCKPPPGWSGR